MKEKLIDFILLTISAFLTAFAVRFFFAQHFLTPGGITGLSITLSSVTNISVSVISLCISLPLLIISTLFFGGEFGVKTLYVTLAVPLALKIVPAINITDSILLAAVVGGLLVGVAIGLAILRKGATGGTDVLAMIVHKFVKNVEIPVILFILDILVVLASMLISHDVMTSIYSAIALFVIMQTIKLTLKVGENE